MTLPFDLNGPLFVPIALGALGFNVLCLAVLLAIRPAIRRARSQAASGPKLGPALLAEFIGTFALILVGTLATIAGPLAGQPEPGLLLVALAYGGTVAAMIAAVGAASGGHFNPAVSLGFVFAGRLNVFAGVGYLLAQLAGAAAAAYLLAALFGPEALVAAVPTPAIGLEVQTVVALEALAGFVLIVVIFGSAVDSRATPGVAPFAVGLAITLAILALGPLTGAALNPARYLAPALVTLRLDDWVTFVAGPVVGCVLGAVLMQFFYVETPSEIIAPRLHRPEESSAEHEVAQG